MKKIKEKFLNLGFTEKEFKIVLFLCSTFLVGCSILVIKSSFPDVKKFDYTETDKEFNEYSSKIDSTYQENENTTDSIEINKFKGLIPGGKKALALSDKKININNDPKKDLMLLPGVGEKMADKIIEYRNVTKFKNIEDIMYVKGIGNKKFEKMKNNITVN